jgi:putative membrane protein
MRSLWYRLTHKPCNLDDCLDLASKAPIKGACLHLRYNELIRKQYVITQLIAELELKQADKYRRIEEICGGYLDSDSENEKLSKITQANAKLKQMASRLSDVGVVLSNVDQEFERHPITINKPSKRLNPYERFVVEELILRDQLAIDRTVLANERTFLAYCRTALALVLTGAGYIKFFDSRFSEIAGWTLIGLGFAVIVTGIWRTLRMTHNIETVHRQFERSPVQRTQPSLQQNEPHKTDADDT